MIPLAFAINFIMVLIGIFLIVGAMYVLRILPRLSVTASAGSALLIGVSGVLLIGFALSFHWDADDSLLGVFLLVLCLGVSLGMKNWVRGSMQDEGFTESRMPPRRKA